MRILDKAGLRGASRIKIFTQIHVKISVCFRISIHSFQASKFGPGELGSSVITDDVKVGGVGDQVGAFGEAGVTVGPIAARIAREPSWNSNAFT